MLIRDPNDLKSEDEFTDSKSDKILIRDDKVSVLLDSVSVLLDSVSVLIWIKEGELLESVSDIVLKIGCGTGVRP